MSRMRSITHIVLQLLMVFLLRFPQSITNVILYFSDVFLKIKTIQLLYIFNWVCERLLMNVSVVASLIICADKTLHWDNLM